MIGQLLATISVAIILSFWDGLNAVIVAILLGEFFVFVMAFRMVNQSDYFEVEIFELASFISKFMIILAGYAFAVSRNEVTFFLAVAIAHLIWMWWSNWRPEIPAMIRNETNKNLENMPLRDLQ